MHRNMDYRLQIQGQESHYLKDDRWKLYFFLIYVFYKRIFQITSVIKYDAVFIQRGLFPMYFDLKFPQLEKTVYKRTSEMFTRVIFFLSILFTPLFSVEPPKSTPVTHVEAPALEVQALSEHSILGKAQEAAPSYEHAFIKMILIVSLPRSMTFFAVR